MATSDVPQLGGVAVVWSRSLSDAGEVGVDDRAACTVMPEMCQGDALHRPLALFCALGAHVKVW